jgi:DNA-binding NarL/FixJ family response regulator
MEKDFVNLGALVADRLEFFRRGMTALLRESRPSWRLAEAGSFDELLAPLRDGDFELLLVDLRLSGLGGTGGVSRLRTLCPAQRVVVMADNDDRGTVLECLAAGAHGYVPRSSTPGQFLRALDAVLSGGVFAPASLTGTPLRPPAAMPPLSIATAALLPLAASPANPRQVLASLTHRQREVFHLLAEGCASKTIARRLGLSVSTVKVHLAAIYRLLGAHSRMEAVAKACGGCVVPPTLSTLVPTAAGQAIVIPPSARQDLSSDP